MSNLNQFKCELCKTVADFVHICKNDHIVCEKCAQSTHFICKCLSKLKNRIENPICNLLQKNCPFEKNGCKWSFPVTEMPTHILECKYRPYRCVGTQLGVWNTCNWEGIQVDFEAHMLESHSELGDFYTHFQNGFLNFDSKNIVSGFNLVNAFSRRFVFYHKSNPINKMVYFIIYLLGRKDDAENYVIDFEIKSSDTNFRKIKFVDQCYSDVENIPQLINDEKCIALTHRTIENHLENGFIHFRFIIKMKKNLNDDDSVDGIKINNSNNSTTKGVGGGGGQPAANRPPNPFTFQNKGSIKSNTAKKPPNFNSIGHQQQQQLQQPSSKPTTDTTEPTTTTMAVQQINVNSSNGEITSTTNNSNVIPCSSINRHEIPHVISPCYTPSINKDDTFDFQQNLKYKSFDRFISEPSGAIAVTPNSGTSASGGRRLPAPYKGVDNKIYRTRYPTTSLEKPRIKK